MRALCEAAGRRLGQPVLVENRPGAAGTLGALHMAREARADGYTIGQMPNGVFRLPALTDRPLWDPMRDFTYILRLVGYMGGIVVRADAPWRDLGELLADARANPGKLSYGSSGTGSSLHLGGVMLDKATGNETLHIPYKGGGPLMLDLIGGHIDYAWQLLGVMQSSVDSGKVRLLGVAALKRYPSMPNVPTMAEQGLPGFEAETVYGIMVPKGTPRAVQEKLNADVVKALESPDVKKKFLEQGMESFPSTQEAFANYLQTNIAKYTKIVRESGIKKD
jgi:tripartite-type tricarboxylate transporter receptor subunit TctC